MQGKFHIPVALYGLMSANNVLIVFNSSVNFIIYCLVEETFRSKLVSILKSWCMGLCHMMACCFSCKLLKVRNFRRVPTVPATADGGEDFPADFPPPRTWFRVCSLAMFCVHHLIQLAMLLNGKVSGHSPE